MSEQLGTCRDCEYPHKLYDGLCVMWKPVPLPSPRPVATQLGRIEQELADHRKETEIDVASAQTILGKLERIEHSLNEICNGQQGNYEKWERECERAQRIEQGLDLLLAIKDDTIRFRELILERFNALEGQIKGGFDGLADEIRSQGGYLEAEKIMEYNRGFNDGLNTAKTRARKRQRKSGKR